MYLDRSTPFSSRDFQHLQDHYKIHEDRRGAVRYVDCRSVRSRGREGNICIN